MEFQDRVSAYPNRYLLTRDDGSKYYVILERADEPIVPGTPLNAETFNGLFRNSIIETGEKNGLKYHVYSDGTAECWGEVTITVIKVGAECRGYVYKSNLAVDFSQIDFANVSLLWGDGDPNVFKSAIISNIETNVETSALVVRFLYANISERTPGVRLSIHVRGVVA